MNDFNWKEDLEATINGYTSPITLLMNDIEMKMEGDICKAVQSYGIQVDKEELLKALNYDRQQYQKAMRMPKKHICGH